jgi:HK97 family phage portal protein
MSLIARAARPGKVAQFNQYGTPVTAVYGNTSVMSSAGERVDEYTALGVTTVLACSNLLADSVASMPLRTFRYSPAGRTEVDLPDVLRKPDVDMTTFDFVHQVMASATLHGNAYIEIVRDRMGNPGQLICVHPYQMQVLPSADQTRRRYLHLGTEIANEDMIHLRWFTPPQSLVGVSPINQQRTIVGLGLAMDRHLAQWYGDGGTPSSVLETDGKLSPDAAQVLRDTWEDTHRRRRRPAVLTDGLKWKPISASAADMELIATREALVAEIARIFKVPPHMLGIKGDGQTYANVEQAGLNFLTYTLLPWMRRIEDALSRVLPDGLNCSFDTSAMLRADSLQRYQLYKLAISAGVMNPNEARSIEGFDPYDGGDAFIQAFQGTALAGGELPVLGTGDGTQTALVGVQE